MAERTSGSSSPTMSRGPRWKMETRYRAERRYGTSSSRSHPELRRSPGAQTLGHYGRLRLRRSRLRWHPHRNLCRHSPHRGSDSGPLLRGLRRDRRGNSGVARLHPDHVDDAAPPSGDDCFVGPIKQSLGHQTRLRYRILDRTLAALPALPPPVPRQGRPPPAPTLPTQTRCPPCAGPTPRRPGPRRSPAARSPRRQGSTCNRRRQRWPGRCANFAARIGNSSAPTKYWSLPPLR